METQLVNQNQVVVKPAMGNRLIELRRVNKAYNVAGGSFLALKDVDM